MQCNSSNNMVKSVSLDSHIVNLIKSEEKMQTGVNF